MASGDKYTIQEDTLTNIGNAIRQMTDSQEGITPEDMPDAIRSINTGYPVLYGTTDPTPAQGSDGQLYAKHAHIGGCEVTIAIYKPTDALTVSITITEDNETVYTATPSCTIYGGYAEVSTTITLSTGTYTLKYWGEEVYTANTESQFVEINNITVGFTHNGSNSSYTVDGSEDVEVEYDGTAVTDVWLKIATDWTPFMLGGNGGAPIVDISQADFDLLPTAAKNNGTLYLITDGDVPNLDEMSF